MELCTELDGDSMGETGVTRKLSSIACSSTDRGPGGGGTSGVCRRKRKVSLALNMNDGEDIITRAEGDYRESSMRVDGCC